MTYTNVTYGEGYDRHGVDVMEPLVACEICGAVVMRDDTDKHDAWHRELISG